MLLKPKLIKYKVNIKSFQINAKKKKGLRGEEGKFDVLLPLN